MSILPDTLPASSLNVPETLWLKSFLIKLRIWKSVTRSGEYRASRAKFIFSIVESKLILPAHLAQATIKPITEAVIYSPYTGIPWYKRPARFFQRINRNIQEKQ